MFSDQESLAQPQAQLARMTLRDRLILESFAEKPFIL
jgi:hypothetical protein